MAGVTLNKVVKRFGGIETIHGVDLDIGDGEFVVFVGPSGCGKSTLLRMIAGLEDISQGTISIGDTVVNDVEAADRGIAMVFQSYALYPHMTVEQNLSFGLRMNGNDRADTERRVKRAASILRIEELLQRRPRALSGGQRQRVAIGRAIVREPKVFLFDEPLSNLDAELRVQMRVEIARLHKELGLTMIYVTHDQTEAMTLADRIMVLRAGSVEQIGRPLDLYDDPGNRFVAGFVGSPAMNFLPGRVVATGDATATIELTSQPSVRITKPMRIPPAIGTDVAVGVRPEHFGEPGQGECDLTLDVDVSEHLGGVSYLYARLPGGEQVIVQRDPSHREVALKQAVVSIAAASVYLFDTSGARLR